MASVAQQLMIDTKVGLRGEKSAKTVSFNQRQDNFTLFAKLSGKPLKKMKVKFETSPNNEDWKVLKEVELENDGDILLDDVKENMLAHCKVSYDESVLSKVTGKGKSKEVEKVADFKAAVLYRDKR